jgi:predicted HTH transcriptional regulator
MSFQSIKDIVESHLFDSLIGQDEDLWFEAKQKNPYDFSTAAGRYELAKDVCAFANAEGGFILIGFTTEVRLAERTDRIIAVDPSLETEFNCSQYEGLIKDHIYPPIKGLKVSWIPSSPQSASGFGVIEIPRQAFKSQYFLIVKVVDEGLQVKQIVFGLAQRVGSSNDPFSVHQLYALMQSGKSPVPQTLSRVEDKIDSLLRAQSNPTPAAASPAELFADRLNSLLTEEPE